MPTLFATSPLAAIRSAPTTIRSTSPRAINAPALPSVTTWKGMPCALELPRRQARALEQRPRLAHPYLRQPPRLPGRAEDAAGSAVAAGGERTGVAVGERAVALGESLGAELGQPAVGGLLLRVERASQRQRPVRPGSPRALDRPAQVDRRRPRVRQLRGGGLEVVPGERQSVRGGQPDRGRSPHGERADRLRHLLRSLTAQPLLPVGQGALVQDQQRAVVEAKRAGAHLPQR